MPLYSYRCEKCSLMTDAFRAIDNRNRTPKCEHYGGKTNKTISLCRVHPDFEPYYDDNLESHIKSKQHRQKVMKDRGVTEAYGKGWT